MSGYVYFIKAEGLPRIKIGYTTGKFSTRKDGTQTMSPVELQRFGVLSAPDVRQMERELHKLFAPYRIWGEWFEFPEHHLSTLKRCVKTKKKSRRHREDKLAFDYESFKSYWVRELGTHV